MKTLAHELEKEIAILTELIRNKYPEVYRNIEEMPIAIPNYASDEVKIIELNNYLDSLKSLIKTHES